MAALPIKLSGRGLGPFPVGSGLLLLGLHYLSCQ